MELVEDQEKILWSKIESEVYDKTMRIASLVSASIVAWLFSLVWSCLFYEKIQGFESEWKSEWWLQFESVCGSALLDIVKEVNWTSVLDKTSKEKSAVIITSTSLPDGRK